MTGTAAPKPFRASRRTLLDGRVWRRLGYAVAALLVASLLYIAVRGVPIPAIVQTLGRLTAWQVCLLIAVDCLVYVLMTARWWLIARATTENVRFLPMIAVKLSAFAASYFTVGPQIGGEPIQVLYFRRKYGSTYARATAGVLLDKLLELGANFVFLMIGLSALIGTGAVRLLDPLADVGVAILAALAAWPLLHILLLRSGRHPVAALLRVVPPLRQGSRIGRYLRVSERLAGQFCRLHEGALWRAMSVSLLACVAAVIEYALMASFFGIHLEAGQVVAAWTAGWLSFLVPVPAGIGALEASQVLALGAFGVPAASAISIALLARARDVLLGGTGLLLAAGTAAQLKSKVSAQAVVSDVQDAGARVPRLTEEMVGGKVDDG